MISDEQMEIILSIIDEATLMKLIDKYPPTQRTTRCKDMTGIHQENGAWTALYRTENKQKGHACWLCLHDDGITFKEVQQDSFKSGHSAGIIKERYPGPTKGKERPDKRVDLTGKIFGHVECIKPTGVRGVGDNRIEWECICHACGRTFYTDSHSFSGSNILTHCGCLS